MYGVSPGHSPHQYYPPPPYSKPARGRRQPVTRTGSSSQPDFSRRPGNSNRPDGSTKKAKAEPKEKQPSFMDRNCGKITVLGGVSTVAGGLICFATVPVGISLLAAGTFTFWFGLAYTGLVNKMLDC
ncbi:hypothetical protein [Endozoicomonas lisbonensis]|uniref:Uncharacterized protein n=1 Tax=Endozoicomonas lisbonensis TaxID=3120522 RepID=A0ABV2SJK0_9GAMM